MKPFFDTEDLRSRLFAEALKWVGTPFADCSEIPGWNGGVSCGYLVVAVLKACGHVPMDRPLPIITWRDSLIGRGSPLENAFDASVQDGLFADVGTNDLSFPGDVLGIRLNNCIDHVALRVTESAVLSIRLRQRAQVAVYSGFRIERVWRPVKLSS